MNRVRRNGLNGKASALRWIAVMVIAALASTVVFATPASAQETTGDEIAADDVGYTDIDEPAVLLLAANDVGPVDLAADADAPDLLVFGMEFGSLTIGLDTDGNEVALYQPMPSFSGVDIGEYMVCWDTVCAGAAVTMYVGTAACTISADDDAGAAVPDDLDADADTADDDASGDPGNADDDPADDDTTDAGDGSDADAADSAPEGIVDEAISGDDDAVDEDALYGDGPVQGVVLYGTDGDDVICGTDGADTIFGGQGDDLIFGRGGDDELLGENGDDLIFGGAGDDTIDGGNDDDTLNGEADDDVITGGPGEDTINGGDGDDEIDGDSQDDTLNGGAGDDTINGGSDADTIDGGDGDDTLNGDSQDDTIFGGAGDDAINGGSDSDTLDGGDGVDSLDGSWQDDTCTSGESYVSCETTDEVVAASAQDGSGDGLTCNGLAATIVGTPGDDVIAGTWQDDVIVGLGGSDTINGQSGADTICGGDGDDVIDGASQDDTIFGGAGDDTIHGRSGADTIDGGPGNDTITGDSQNDVIHGGDDDDDINGGAGDDTLDGGNGVDYVDGLWGTDSCDDAETAPNCELVTYNGESDEPTDPPNEDPFSCNGLTATIVGTPGDDVIAGTWQDDVIVGLGGNDTINGQSGADTICGGDGDDVIDGASQNDTIFGNAGNDTIYGRSGADVIEGGPGNDLITGDSQQDIINGGEGDDDINGGSDSDTLDGGPGVDVINGSWQNDTCSNGETYTSCETIEEPDPTDGDSDGDGVLDEDDAFPNDPTETTDTDGDGTGDNADLDDDNDGTLDDQDAFPLDPTEDTDTDGDGVGDNADDDIDGDGIPNDQDAFPLDPTEDTDTDGDGTGDNADAFPNDPSETIDSDGDGTGDNSDAFPNDPNETVDSDGDGTGDNSDAFPDDPAEDTDSDGDGVGDNADAFPEDETETVDSDGDGTGDNGDAFPDDPAEDTDTDGDGAGNNEDEDDDNDGILDEDDAYPLDPDETGDADGDGIGDNADPDDDNDGVNDDQDAFPLDPTEQTDTDGDGVGDNTDAFPEDPYEYADSDGDGVGDNFDEFPEDGSENSDSDGDGVGDNSDVDDDNDGVPDVDDDLPFNPSESTDSDGAGVGDNADPDDDNDGYHDDVDAFPLDPAEWLDTDGDGIGDNADTDDDGDGVTDELDDLPLDESDSVDTDGDGIGDDLDSDDDNDGVEDGIDLWPLDPTRSFDLDGDGVSDEFDGDADADGVADSYDAFPLDPEEWLDTDGDGIGNNADSDDDGDGVAEGADAFPLNPLESSDDDGNGVGDVRDGERDNDDDGVANRADDDLDGDGVPNSQDAFPSQIAEWLDTDGDGIGNNADDDDDGDGAPDNTDLEGPILAGPDSDGDGTPDLYDLDPDSAGETRFLITESGGNGATAQIISSELIPLGATSITTRASAGSQIAGVAASPIVDFTISGSNQSFESARITLPLDPALAQPGAVKVLWRDAVSGLWIPEGIDLVVDPATATVSVTVDHFSEYAAVPSEAFPIAVPPGQYDCRTSGSDVVLVVDVSGSMNYGYVVRGDAIPAGDPVRAAVTRRQVASDIVLEALDIDADRVALISFAGTPEAGSLESGATGFAQLRADMENALDSPRSETEARDALQEALSVLPDDANGRAQSVVLISDGRFMLPTNLQRFRDADIPVHTMVVGGGDETLMQEIANQTGGVYVTNGNDILAGEIFPQSAIDTLQARLGEAAIGSATADFDRDGITDCAELNGVPLVEGIQWIRDGDQVNAHDPQFWPTTSASDFDTDDDFLWDSEEYVITDLRNSPALAAEYQRVLDAGFGLVYRYRGNPNDQNDPVTLDGVNVRTEGLNRYVPAPHTPALAEAKQVRREVTNPVPAYPVFDAADARLFLEHLALEWSFDPVGSPVTIEALDDAYRDLELAVETRPAEFRPTAEFEAAFDAGKAQVATLFNETDFVTNPDQDVDSVARSYIDRIEALDLERLDQSISTQERALKAVERDSLMVSLAQRVLRQQLITPEFGPVDVFEVSQLFEDLQSRYVWIEDEDDNSPPHQMKLSTAYRLVTLYFDSPLKLQQRLDYIEDLLSWQGDGPGISPDDFAGTRAQYEELVLEVRAGRAEQIDRAIQAVPISPFLTDDQAAAFNWLASQFAFNGDEETKPRFYSALLDGEPTVQPFSVPSEHFLYTDLLEDAQAQLTADQFVAFQSIFDDVAFSHLLGSSWSSVKRFGAGQDYDLVDSIGPVGQYMSDRLVELDQWDRVSTNVPLPTLTPGGPAGGSTALFDDVIDQLHPGIVTAEDVIRFSNFMFLRLLAPSNYALLQLNEDSTINAGDLEDLRGLAEDGEITEAEADAFISLATTVGLVDTNFDLDSLITVLETFGLISSIAGVVLLTGGSGLAPYLLAAGALSEGGVAVVKLSQGNFGGAAFSAVFMVFDGAELAKAAQGILTRSQRAFRVLRGLDTVADGAGLIGDADRLVDAARLRAADVNVSDAGELAVIEASTREDLFVEMAALTTPARADAYVDAYFDSLVETLDDASNYDELLAAVRSDPAGPDAYVRWGDEVIDEAGALVDDFADAVRGCPLELAGNSFGGSTYVVLVDGSRKRIESIQVGDLVAGWDTSHGLVSSEVTATWPHTDVLYQAVLSDASMLVVTEDHDFFDLADQDWAEIATFGPASEFLSIDGEPVGLDSFDFSASTTAAAYDLTVAGTHNYFVAADLTSHAVLAHNQGGPCPKFEVSSDLVRGVSALGETDYIRMVDIGNAFVDGGRFSDGGALADELVAFIKAADPETRTRLLSNPRWVEEAGTAGPGRFSGVLNAGLAQPTMFDRWGVEKLSALIARSDSDEIFARLAGLPEDRIGSTQILDMVALRDDAVDLLDAFAESKGYRDLIQRRLDGGQGFLANRIADAVIDFRQAGASFGPEFAGPNAAANLAQQLPVSGTRRLVWDLNNFDRGDVAEELYYVSRGGRQPPELDDIRAAFYPRVDSRFVEDGVRVAEQLKTADFAGQIQTVRAIEDWQDRMRTAINALDLVETDGIGAYSRLGLIIPDVPPNSFDEYVLRIEFSGYSPDPGIATRQQLAMQTIVDEAADRGVIVIVQALSS